MLSLWRKMTLQDKWLVSTTPLKKGTRASVRPWTSKAWNNSIIMSPVQSSSHTTMIKKARIQFRDHLSVKTLTICIILILQTGNPETSSIRMKPCQLFLNLSFVQANLMSKISSRRLGRFQTLMTSWPNLKKTISTSEQKNERSNFLTASKNLQSEERL